MLKVGTAIVERQKKFLEKGAQFIEPMVLRDIADAVEMLKVQLAGLLLDH